MNLVLKLAWEYRISWLAMGALTAASALVMIISTHVTRANDIVSAANGQISLNIDLYLALLATFLITQTIAALCLESQAKDLAIIKTCGASQRAIRRTLFGEIIAVTLVGFVVGLLISLFIRETYVHAAITYMSQASDQYFGHSFGAYVTAAIALFAAVLLGSFRTIIRVSRQNVVTALHGDDAANGKRKKHIGGILVAVLAFIFNGLVLLVSVNAGRLVELVKEFADTNQEAASLGVVASAQGSVVMFPPIFFVMGTMIFFAALAPILYRVILGWLARLLPRTAPASLQVGINQARFNATKYYGSITPLVIFVLAIIMIFTAVDGSTPAVMALYEQHGVDTSQLTGTNYGVIAFMIGPAIFIAFVGSLCNIMMSGRGRIYTSKLTAILGARSSTQLTQSFIEMASYVFVAAVLGLITMLIAAWMAWVAGNQVTGETQPFIVSWPWYFLAVGTSFVIVAVPAVTAAIRSLRLPNRAVLEVFGE